LNTVWQAFLETFAKNSKIELYASEKDATADLLELRKYVS
jgi:hypothetical protein